MLTDDHITDIQNIIKSCNSNEELQSKLKLYCLVHVETLKDVDPSRLAWEIYQNVILKSRRR